ncbi:MAG: signal transduction histidine kinase, partial [Paracoccaceae bacterium]
VVLHLINSGQMWVLPAPLSSVAEIALRNSNRLAFLIDDLLDFQKLKIGKMVFKFAELDLAKLVKDAVEINGSYGDTESVTINLIQPDAPMFVKGDPDRLMQVLTNVLSNAIKFSPAGGEVDVSLDQIDGKARVLIADHGIGIPEGSEDLVFGPFMQVDCSDVRDFGGTGLGMSISKEILDGHDGSISYTSEIGVGTTFAIQIDLLPVTEMPKVEPCLTKTSAAMIPIASVQAA